MWPKMTFMKGKRIDNIYNLWQSYSKHQLVLFLHQCPCYFLMLEGFFDQGNKEMIILSPDFWLHDTDIQYIRKEKVHLISLFFSHLLLFHVWYICIILVSNTFFSSHSLCCLPVKESMLLILHRRNNRLKSCPCPHIASSLKCKIIE